MSDFNTRTIGSDVTVIQPKGRLNMGGASTLRKQLQGIVDGGSSRIVVDLSATEFVDSSGLGALISGLKIARQAGGDLRITATPAQVTTVLELTNLNRVLPTYDSADTAFDD
ncbi:STAS domain-containing protein [Mycolicibacterium hodleri]|uniref:Anti-sigma factor antagonist n=1 Tax=Mycolicibacterium hodleri TaxID=49897 RepID=A0A502DS89_9MYCO|nr:STAS domain-containing protein [Mycolicibacterium hodleri]TPG28197.1 anti-sigma factor antagonist [Mycolicibacterium hodleri]